MKKILVKIGDPNPKRSPRAISCERVEFIPFSLVPSPLPRTEYEAVRDLQPLVNELMLRVSRDIGFLRAALGEVALVDDFTRRLLEMHELALAEGNRQSICLGLLRADYMLEAARLNSSITRCKQVEVNTIASGHGWIGTASSRLHRYILQELDASESLASLPENNPLEGLCSGMLEAWRLYDSPSARILMVVEEVGHHAIEQRQHEYALRELEPRVRLMRLTLGEIGKRARLDAERRLLVDGREIGLVYFRFGYAPDNYPSELEWSARLVVERSMAIKCPSLGLQLAGTKKVQQLLAQPECLAKFLPQHDCARITPFFTGLYSLDFNEAGEAAIEMALKRPNDFVLKPQREGGLNNLFGEDIRKKLQSMRNTSERNAWILMDKIMPVAHKNYLVRPDGQYNNRLENCNSELGIFGVMLANGDKMIGNRAVGHTLRTKLVNFNEGGISSGYGACDSPMLV